MASTLTKLLVHIVFSTQNRVDLIPEAIEPDLACPDQKGERTQESS